MAYNVPKCESLEKEEKRKEYEPDIRITLFASEEMPDQTE